MPATQREDFVTAPVVNRVPVNEEFVSRLLEDILQFGDEIEIQITNEGEAARDWPVEDVPAAREQLESREIGSLTIRYTYSGEIWRDHLNRGSSGIEFSRLREWLAESP